MEPNNPPTSSAAAGQAVEARMLRLALPARSRRSLRRWISLQVGRGQSADGGAGCAGRQARAQRHPLHVLAKQLQLPPRCRPLGAAAVFPPGVYLGDAEGVLSRGVCRAAITPK